MKREDEMRAVFARFEQSGMTLKAFGEREGISYTSLQYWRRMLGGKRDTKQPSRGCWELHDPDSSPCCSRPPTG